MLPWGIDDHWASKRTQGFWRMSNGMRYLSIHPKKKNKTKRKTTKITSGNDIKLRAVSNPKTTINNVAWRMAQGYKDTLDSIQGTSVNIVEKARRLIVFCREETKRYEIILQLSFRYQFPINTSTRNTSIDWLSYRRRFFNVKVVGRKKGPFWFGWRALNGGWFVRWSQLQLPFDWQVQQYTA